jgi:hypothetical protein
VEGESRSKRNGVKAVPFLLSLEALSFLVGPYKFELSIVGEI